MIKIKTLMKMIPFLVMGMLVLNSCEGELDDLGSQLVVGNAADGVDEAYSLIAYNISNKDTIQADASKLDSVRIGAFKENVFGGQKVSYITQVRLNTYNPDFGTNPVIDSVVLTLKPKYETATDSIKTNTDEAYIYPDGAVAAKKVVTNYRVSKYGKYKLGTQNTKFTIKVHEVNDFLGGTSDKLSSDKVVALNPNEIGTKDFDGNITSVKITKDSDNSDIVPEIPASLRINLSKDFFQSKIIAKKGDQVLKDAASFIRYFKGISISVLEDDGYLFSMAPNDAAITIYYKNDVTETNGTVTRTKAETSLNLGSGNVHLSKIVYDRPGSYLAAVSPTLPPNDVTGNTVIYAQGMGGASFGVKIPVSTIELLRNKYKNDKIALVSAKIRLYNDDVIWDNKYKKPYSLLVRDKASTGFLPDMTELANAGYSLVKIANYSTKDAYYDIGITASLKKIIEDPAFDASTSTGKDFIINVGSYLSDSSTGLLLGQKYNNRAYVPSRIVLKGTDQNNIGQVIKDEDNKKAAQLRLIYTQK